MSHRFGTQVREKSCLFLFGNVYPIFSLLIQQHQCLLLEASQRYDKSYMEHKEMQEKRMENTIQILNSNSVDIHQTPSWLEIENNQNDGIGTPSAPGTDNNIYPKDSAEI
jgi:hypothetical protein